MITLSKDQIIQLHSIQINTTGGLNGLRDDALLDSALSSAFQTFGGVDIFPSVIAKIARIAYGLVNNHPFVDGNKRIGTYVMLVLLELNNIFIDFTDDDIIRIGLSLADGSMSDTQLFELLFDRSK